MNIARVFGYGVIYILRNTRKKLFLDAAFPCQNHSLTVSSITWVSDIFKKIRGPLRGPFPHVD